MVDELTSFGVGRFFAFARLVGGRHACYFVQCTRFKSPPANICLSKTSVIPHPTGHLPAQRERQKTPRGAACYGSAAPSGFPSQPAWPPPLSASRTPHLRLPQRRHPSSVVCHSASCGAFLGRKVGALHARCFGEGFARERKALRPRTAASVAFDRFQPGSPCPPVQNRAERTAET